MSQASTHTPSAERPRTLGQLRASGYRTRGVKEEIRANLLHRLRSGERAFPGIVGFEDTVLPELEAALLAGHDFVLLGERGQGKTRLMRTVGQLLDEWIPVVDGCEINDDPYQPVCVRCRALAAETADDLPIGWLHREDRYTEKLATPDTSVGDLIGDVDPVKVAEGRTLGDPETIHYGLVPRTHRGVFGLNELPDLAERIQVALFNVLEERDIQVRGYSIRLPLDVLVIATANPEDYTNRGRIITPLKDRFGGEIRTHYLSDVSDEVDLLRQESHLVAEVGDHLLGPSPGSAAACGIHRRSTSGPVSPRGSRSRRPRRSRPRRCVVPHAPANRRRWPGSVIFRRSCRPCWARSSSRWVKRVGRPRSLIIS
jgi:magnesium chelatase subunit I